MIVSDSRASNDRVSSRPLPDHPMCRPSASDTPGLSSMIWCLWPLRIEDLLSRWDVAAPERILKGLGVDDPSQFIKPEELDRLFREKRLDAFGQVAAQYAGYSPSNPAFDAYCAVAA
jgi:hypothetical protein